MTEQQAKQIREMREQGIGYRSIALTVGLSRDIVRNFCKSRGLSGYGSALTKNIREQVMLGKACLYCGKEMNQRSSAQINADGNGGKDTRNESTEKRVPCTLRCVCVAVKSS